MSVTFVIGRSGTGKTLRCFDRIVEGLRADPLGPPIYWIVPRQATFETERRLTCGSGLPGFCRARVLGFATLGKEILGEAGGSEMPQVTGIGRQMILGHLLRRHASELVFFKSVERQAGLAAELDATFDELERAGKNAADLVALLDDLSHSGPLDVEAETLVAKLHDVRLLYDAYNDFLGQDRVDPYRRLQQVLEAVKGCTFLRGAMVYVDGFIEFTDHERKMLGALARAGATLEITLVMDPASQMLKNPHLNPYEMGLFHRTETTYRRLWFTFSQEHVAVNDTVLLKDNQRSKSDTLTRLEKEMFLVRNTAKSKKITAGLRLQPPPTSTKNATEPKANSPAQSAIEFIEAPDRAAEVDAVARRIRARLHAGDRMRDVAVLARSLENYRPLIATSFQEHGITYFVDYRRSAAHHPLICFLRAALNAARFDWNHDSVTALTKTGLAGLSLTEADELENYVLLHRVRGAMWESPEPWTWRRDLLRRESEASIDAAENDLLRIDSLRRRVSDGLLPLVQLLRTGKPLKVAMVAGEIFATFERFDIRRSLARWIESAGESNRETLESAGSLIEQREVHEQVWTNLCELFDEMVEILGTESVTPADFIDIVESGLDRFDLGITPPTVDQVLVGGVDRTRCPPVKSVFVLGLNEGEFPARPRDATVLSDRERREMGKRKLELDPDGHRQLLDERLLGYITFTQPSHHLILSRPLGDNAGRTAAPSAFWRDIRELFPDCAVERVARESNSDVGQIATPRQLVTGLMRWIRASKPGSIAETSADWFALYHWLVAHGPEHRTILHLATNAWPALSYTNESHLSPEMAARLFSAPLSVSARQLETMAECPFKYFVRHGLKLSSREKDSVGGGDLGQVYHRLLDELVSVAIENSATGDAGPLAISTNAIHAAAEGVARSIRGELMLSSARNRYLLDRVERTLADVIASQQAVMKKMRYRPAKAGVSFGAGSSSIPALQITTPGGAELNVVGRIDRIDTLPEGNDALIIDYRLGANSLSLIEVYHGLSLQLLACLLLLQSAGEQIAGKALKPTAAFFLKLVRSFGDVKHPSEAADPTDEKFLLGIKPRGIFDLQALGDLDTSLQSGPSLVVQAYLKQDGKIGYPGTTDSASAEDFQAILRLVAKQIGKLGDEILSGNVAIAPYRLAKKTPCPTCEFRGICRFETPMNRYHHLISLGRDQVLETLRQEAGNGK